MNTSTATFPKIASLTATPFSIRAERASDVPAREALLDACFGTDRSARTCQRLREGRTPARGLAFSAVRGGRLVGTIRLWSISAGGRPSLVLGPLAVDPMMRELGIGAALVRHAIQAATERSHDSIILLGDAPYYERFGFSAAKAANLQLPGAFERERLLGLELRDGALDGAWGMIVPTGATVRDRLKAEPTRRLAVKAA